MNEPLNHNNRVPFHLNLNGNFLGTNDHQSYKGPEVKTVT